MKASSLPLVPAARLEQARRFMSLYVSTKHAVEGYSQSLDHEVREHGVRILLVEPGPINTPCGAHSVQADTPMPLYEPGRRNYEEVLAKNTSSGDEPSVVAKVIVAAASTRRHADHWRQTGEHHPDVLEQNETTPPNKGGAGFYFEH